MEKGVAAVASDVADIMATADQPLTFQTQINSIERQLREPKIEIRLGAFEDNVFGAPRKPSS